MIVDSYHRNYSLALRHLAALRRENPGQQVELLSRRNAQGRYSSRGHNFRFEVIGEKPTGKGIEFVAHFDYGSKKKGSVIEMQLHIFAPEGTTDNEALQAIRDRALGKPWPSKKWQARMLEYKSGKKSLRKNEGANKLPKGLVNTTMAEGSGRVTSRVAVSSNRRTRRKTK
jgi:hypothetical protein